MNSIKRIIKAFVRRLSFFSLVIYYKFFKRRENILHLPGIHFIGGSTGSGKTLLSSLIINNICDKKSDNFFWTNIDQYDKENTKAFEFNDVIQNGKLIKRLDNYYCQGLVIDEANLMFNRRINNRTSYNDLFLGLQQLLVSHRHLGIPRVYLIGQHFELQDIQLQRDVRYIHRVASKKRYSYNIYLDQKKIKKRPIKIYVKTFYKNDSDMLIPIKKQKIKVSYEDLKRYNTFGFLEYFKELPIHKKQ